MKHQKKLAIVCLLQAYTMGCPEPPKAVIAPSTGNTMDMDTDGMDMTSDMAGDMSLDMTSDMAPDMMVDMGVDMASDMAPDMVDMACEPESVAQFCARNNYSCGELVAEDNCGEERTEVCGESCDLPQTCLAEMDETTSAVTGKACGCDFENVEEICTQVGKLCGSLSAPCSEMVCNNFCVDQVAAGSEYNCAMGSGKLRCWGNNAKGQLGIGTTQSEKNPIPLALEVGVLEVAAGDTHSCAILDDTSLICWGNNSNGQLGISTTVDQNKPDLVDANSRAFVKGVHKVVVGEYHTCALVDDDFDPVTMSAPEGPYSAYCWGSNQQGAIGNPDRIIVGADAGAPVLVKGLYNNVVDIAAGYNHNCAIVQGAGVADDKRQIQCWGLDDSGQIGSRDIQSAELFELTEMGRREQIDVPDPAYPDDPTKTIKQDVATGFYHHYMYNTNEDNRIIVVLSPTVVRDDRPSGSVTTESNVNTYQSFEGEFVEIVAGASSSCARRADGSFSCWGVLPYQHDSASCKVPLHGAPASVSPLSVAECSAWPPTAQWNSDSIIMMKKPGSTDSAYGLPTGSVDFRAIAPRPVDVVHHPSDPTVYPSYLTGGEVVKALQLSAHNDHVCVLLDDSDYLPPMGSEPSFTNVHCFGNNNSGQLGDSSNSPIGYPIKLTTDVDGVIVRGSLVSVGESHSCVVADNNNIKCWGSNKASQLGNENLLKDESFRPFDVLLQ